MRAAEYVKKGDPTLPASPDMAIIGVQVRRADGRTCSMEMRLAEYGDAFAEQFIDTWTKHMLPSLYADGVLS